MVLCKMDPDITRWGLHHLLPGGVASDYSAPTTTTAVADFTGYAQLDGHTSVDINIEHVTCNNAVENDEIIAQALQEELSQIAQAEAFGAFSSADDNRSAVLAQEWSHPRIIHVAASGKKKNPPTLTKIHHNANPNHGTFVLTCTSNFKVVLQLPLLSRQKAENLLPHVRTLETIMSKMASLA
ncbi:hypothetical protein PR202_gb29614 [Eleusine coracana subsp. coracana]|uniref:Uncharacterized protein n=1 Tax=Eleusine coracana subsp. coracana TaxID=191504 RepID=A0AAV5G0L8_ELECO|nr:hypothetical protein PR202_gb29614 [Eleusine coracana subsp. coracana]